MYERYKDGDLNWIGPRPLEIKDIYGYKWAIRRGD